MRLVVRTNLESDLVLSGENITPCHWLPRAGNVLIDDRRRFAQLLSRKLQDKIAVSVDARLQFTIKAELNRMRISAGRNFEIVLELRLPAVIREADSRINFVVANPRVGWYVGAPLCRVVAQ